MDEQVPVQEVVCGRCGAPAPVGGRFCGSCGAALGSDQSDTLVLPDPTADPAADPAAAPTAPVTEPVPATAGSGPAGIPVGGVALQADGRFARYDGMDAYGHPVWTQAQAPVGGYYYQYVDAATGYTTAWYTQPAYGSTTPAYGSTTPAYGTTAPAYGSTTPAYGTPPPYGSSPYGVPPGYGTPPYGSTPGTNGLAIASLVLGIVWVYWVGSVLALVLGYVALSQIKRTGQGGRGMAIAGIVLGWIAVGLFVVFVVIGIVSAATSGPDYSY